MCCEHSIQNPAELVLPSTNTPVEPLCVPPGTGRVWGWTHDAHHMYLVYTSPVVRQGRAWYVENWLFHLELEHVCGVGGGGGGLCVCV